MAEKRFDVLTRFRVFNSGAVRGIAQMGAAARKLDAQIAGVNSRMLAFAAAGVGGYGIARATRGMIDFNRELESSKLAVATLLQQSGNAGFRSWNAALSESNRLMQVFRERGAALPGSVDDFRRGFEVLLPVTSRAGASMEELLKLSERVVVAAKVGNVDGGANVVARDIRQILTGSASAGEISTVQLQGRLRELTDLAKKDQAAALREISNVLRVSGSALATYGQSFDAQWSTALDNARQFVVTMGAPAFEFVRAELQAANAWLVANREQVEEMAKAIGERMVNGLKAAGRLAKALVRHWDTIKSTVLFLAEVVIANKLVSAIGAVVTAINGAGGIVGALKMAITFAASLAASLGVVHGTATKIHDAMFDPTQAKREKADARAAELVKGIQKGTATRQEVQQAISDPNNPFVRRALAVEIRKYIDGETTTGPIGAAVAAAFGSASRSARQAYGPGATNLPSFGAYKADKRALRNAFGPVRDLPDDKLIAEVLRNVQQGADLRGFQLAPEGTLPGITATPTPVDPKAKKGLVPPVNIKVDRIIMNQNFDEGDPDRIALAIRGAIAQPFIPRLTSSFNPAR